MHHSEPDYTFTDRELQELLNLLEQRALGGACRLNDLDIMDFNPSSEAQSLQQSPSILGLQFQPHELALMQVHTPSPTALSHESQQNVPELARKSIMEQHLNIQLPASPPLPLADHALLPATIPSSHIAPAEFNMLARASSLSRAAIVEGPSSATSRGPKRNADHSEKPNVSHSTFEKQRRDRINSLIDELRELVPPQPSSSSCASHSGPASSSRMHAQDMRRPKHVVLADTIALLKLLQSKGVLLRQSGAGPQQGAHTMTVDPEPQMQDIKPLEAALKEEVVIKDEPGTSTSSQEHDGDYHVERTVAPQLPHIPMPHNPNSGVAVERGPDCMYVQVRCRDRKGLLSDIIEALKALPLQIRTASVTTDASGLVRDVFEVTTDDETLQTDAIQNKVHDALFEHRACQRTSKAKRARSIEHNNG